MNDDLRLDQDGEALVKGFERLKLNAYICPAGKLTIGWGHTNDHGRQFSAGTVWTEAECEAAFRDDMFGFECHVHSLVKVPVTQGQFNALVSFAYNCGWGALAKSTLLKKLNQGDVNGAAREFLKWTHGGPYHQEFRGLVRRRHAEMAMFLSVPVSHDADGDEDMPQAVNLPRVPPINTMPAALSSGSMVAAFAAISDKLSSFELTDPVVLVCLAALVAVSITYFAYYRAHHEAHA